MANYEITAVQYGRAWVRAETQIELERIIDRLDAGDFDWRPLLIKDVSEIYEPQPDLFAVRS